MFLFVLKSILVLFPCNKFMFGVTTPLLQTEQHAFVLWESSAIRLRRLGHFYRRPHTQRTSGRTETTDPMPWERALQETERWEKHRQGFFRYGGDVLHCRNCPSDLGACNNPVRRTNEWMNGNDWLNGEHAGQEKEMRKNHLPHNTGWITVDSVIVQRMNEAHRIMLRLSAF